MPPQTSAVEAPPPGVRDDLGWALGTLLRAYVRAADAVLAGLPGGTRGYKMLGAVARDCPSNQVSLGHLVGLDRTVVTYLLDDLVAAGLVERTPDPADRRARRVVATDAGRARLAEAETQLHRVEQRLLRDLGDAECRELRSLLQRVAMTAHSRGEDLGASSAMCPAGGDLNAT